MKMVRRTQGPIVQPRRRRAASRSLRREARGARGPANTRNLSPADKGLVTWLSGGSLANWNCLISIYPKISPHGGLHRRGEMLTCGMRPILSAKRQNLLCPPAFDETRFTRFGHFLSAMYCDCERLWSSSVRWTSCEQWWQHCWFLNVHFNYFNFYSEYF